METPFNKYKDKGAYHWKALYDQRWFRQSPRLHARYDIPIKILSENLDLRNSRGVDVGCGDGILLYKVRKIGGHLIGLDKSEEGLNLARMKLKAHGVDPGRLIEASCYDIPLGSESVDYVTGVEIIEHLSKVPEFLEEVRRVLRPEGLFVCTTPNRKEEQGPEEVRDPFHVHEFTSSELKSTLSTHFESSTIYGAYSKGLDRTYVRGRRSSWVDNFLRVTFRAFSFSIFNPYVKYLTKEPDSTENMLVAKCKK